MSSVVSDRLDSSSESVSTTRRFRTFNRCLRGIFVNNSAPPVKSTGIVESRRDECAMGGTIANWGGVGWRRVRRGPRTTVERTARCYLFFFELRTSCVLRVSPADACGSHKGSPVHQRSCRRSSGHTKSRACFPAALNFSCCRETCADRERLASTLAVGKLAASLNTVPRLRTHLVECLWNLWDFLKILSGQFVYVSVQYASTFAQTRE